MKKLTGNECDLIIEILDFISDMPTGYEPIIEKMDNKYGLDEEDFYILKDKLIYKLTT
mgnify:CR=1 FL=1